MNPVLAVRMSLAFSKIVRDPDRLDVVFDLIDSFSDDPKSAEQFEIMLRDPAVAEAAKRRVRCPDLTLEGLDALPEGSLARVAARFFREHGLDPAALPRREANTDAEWLSAHLYETHDLWHVVTGFSPDVPGELGLQAFYAAQVEGPVAHTILAAGMLNTILFANEQGRARLAAIARGWEMGARASTLIGLDWSILLGLPLAEVRERLGVTVDARHDVVAERNLDLAA